MRLLPLARIRDALIVAPHSDDETIGAHGLMRALVRRGGRVRVVVVTDGAGSHHNSRRWPRRRLIRARRDESRRAMRRIGIGAGEVTFLGLPDGALSEIARGLRRTLERVLARRTDLLVLPAADDDHPDHRMVSESAKRVHTRARRIEYLVWPVRGRGSRGPVVGLRPDVARKRHAVASYGTQMGVISDDPAGFAISRKQLASFCRPFEAFRVIRW